MTKNRVFWHFDVILPKKTLWECLGTPQGVYGDPLGGIRVPPESVWRPYGGHFWGILGQIWPKIDFLAILATFVPKNTPWVCLGTPWGVFGDPVGVFGHPQGVSGDPTGVILGVFLGTKAAKMAKKSIFCHICPKTPQK